MRPMRSLNRTVMLLGHGFPLVAVGLAGFTLLTSILGATIFTGGGKLVSLGALWPALVLEGQIWRLLTWPFFETEPLSLIFVCLMLLWFGRDLAYAWGPERLLGVYVAFAAVIALATCVVGLVWESVLARPYVTPWPLVDALIVAWALRFPHRQVLVMFIMPMAGQQLVYVTLGITAVFALLTGPSGMVPHFLAIGLMWVWMRGDSPSTLWLRLRYRLLDWQRRRSRSHLRPVERPRDDPDKPRWYH